MSDSDDEMVMRDERQPPPPSLDESERAWEATVVRDVVVGQRIGEYEVRRRIGSGGMGVVYEGEHPIIGRKVAIKLIRPDSSEGVRSRDLISEARATSAIRHRGIIDIFGFGTLPGLGQYLIMEYLTGRPLDEVLHDRGPLPPTEAIPLIIEVLGALSAAHGVGVIHRDLKPGNLFVVQESNGTEYMKVLDFGLAKQAAAPHSATPQTRASMIVGTPDYMAPEQACGQAVSPRTDLYAVGIILFEMLTGRLPFHAATPMQMAIHQVQTPPPAPSSFVEGLPPELDMLVLRLLAKNPEQRPASAEEVARQLKFIARTIAAESTQVATHPRSAPEPLPAPRAQVRPGAARAMAPRAPSGRRSGRVASVVETRTAPRTLSGSRPAVPEPSPTATRVTTPPRDTRAVVTDRLERAPNPGSHTARRVAVGVAMLFVGLGTTLFLHTPEAPKPGVSPQTRPVRSPAASEPLTAPSTQPATTPTAVSILAGGEAPSSAPPKTNPDPSRTTRSTTTAKKNRAPSGEGTLTLVSECWAEVYVDGSYMGKMPPLHDMMLSTGTHTLELRDNHAIQKRRQDFEIDPGKQTTLEVTCQFED
ncbi:protein kinase [Cystobacter fuscus]|uniref:serine/threonine-protein kinase n=1 Tax=Cystobacter fuscus TaxID=43 RepID=UPI002B30A4E6|nr:protein kinase [Cystobacter fuscus]